MTFILPKPKLLSALKNPNEIDSTAELAVVGNRKQTKQNQQTVTKDN
jgi:hypothetical protein